MSVVRPSDRGTKRELRAFQLRSPAPARRLLRHRNSTGKDAGRGLLQGRRHPDR